MRHLTQLDGGIASWNPINHPVASAKPHRRSEGTCLPTRGGTVGRSVLCVLAALHGAWLPRPRMGAAGHPLLLGWRRRRQREPGSLHDDEAGYIRRPRGAHGPEQPMTPPVPGGQVTSRQI